MLSPTGIDLSGRDQYPLDKNYLDQVQNTAHREKNGQSASEGKNLPGDCHLAAHTILSTFFSLEPPNQVYFNSHGLRRAPCDVFGHMRSPREREK